RTLGGPRRCRPRPRTLPATGSWPMRSAVRSRAIDPNGDEAFDRRNPRPFVLQVLGWSNRDAVAVIIGVLGTIAILANVLFLQSGPHPAPMLKTGLIPAIPAA